MFDQSYSAGSTKIGLGSTTSRSGSTNLGRSSSKSRATSATSRLGWTTHGLILTESVLGSAELRPFSTNVKICPLAPQCEVGDARLKHYNRAGASAGRFRASLADTRPEFEECRPIRLRSVEVERVAKLARSKGHWEYCTQSTSDVVIHSANMSIARLCFGRASMLPSFDAAEPNSWSRVLKSATGQAKPGRL